MLPSDLKSKSRKLLKRPAAPSAAEVLAGNREPALTDEQKAGIKAAAILAKRYLSECENENIARQKALAERTKAREDAVWAAYQQRVKEAIG
jgi:hypothetical protein